MEGWDSSGSGTCHQLRRARLTTAAGLVNQLVEAQREHNRLMQLVDTVYETEGQLVATSNATVDQLITEWGGNEAGTMLRRIGAGVGAKSIYFVAAVFMLPPRLVGRVL
jgi:hypothetical protein